jgi:hypothetical protein
MSGLPVGPELRREPEERKELRHDLRRDLRDPLDERRFDNGMVHLCYAPGREETAARLGRLARGSGDRR